MTDKVCHVLLAFLLFLPYHAYALDVEITDVCFTPGCEALFDDLFKLGLNTLNFCEVKIQKRRWARVTVQYTLTKTKKVLI